jgi:hypothetical protein
MIGRLRPKTGSRAPSQLLSRCESANLTLPGQVRVARQSNSEGSHIKPLTSRPPPRVRTYLVRRTSITSVLLIVAVVTSASTCVAACGSQTAPSCPRTSTRRACTGRGRIKRLYFSL